jgi:hypothetical protein
MLQVGIISAPRSVYYLGQSLDSFFASWSNLTPHVFKEPGCPAHFNQNRIVEYFNRETLGCVMNWLNAAAWMYENTWDDYIMMCEDDIQWQPDAAMTIAPQLLSWPSDAGYLSPYCALPNTPHTLGWSLSKTKGLGQLGALCTIFHRSTLKRLLDHSEMFLYYAAAHHKDGKPCCLDYPIGRVVEKHLGLKVYTHTPTLITHLGEVSTFDWSQHLTPQMIRARTPSSGRHPDNK